MDGSADSAFFLALVEDLVYTMISGCLYNHRTGGDLVSTGSVSCHLPFEVDRKAS